MPIELADIDAMFNAYLECALWSGTDYAEEDSEPEPLDANHDVDDIAEETLAELFSDCIGFLSMADAADLAVWLRHFNFEQIGHDFCLTRNGHGAGFWDRFYGGTPEEAAGDRLTEIAHSFGSSDLYIGDDGLIYV